MENIKFDAHELKKLYQSIGFMNPAGGQYKERIGKNKQVYDYLLQITAALKKLSTKNEIVLLDCACGRSYLSFIVYYYCQEILKRKIRIIGVDSNPDLIFKCNNIAFEMEFKNLTFYCSDIIDFKPEYKLDIVYCLHACNTATDQAIAKGIIEKAKYIMTVSCCQHTTMAQIKKHPLTSITRFKPFKERIVDMVSDSMRALLLESLGYNVDVFEFTSSKNTAKNIMLRAVSGNRNMAKEEMAEYEYRKLLNTFHIRPAAERYLQTEDVYEPSIICY